MTKDGGVVCEGETVMWSEVLHSEATAHASLTLVSRFQVPGFWKPRNQRKPVEIRKLFGKFPDEEGKQEANVGGKGVMILIWIK